MYCKGLVTIRCWWCEGVELLQSIKGSRPKKRVGEVGKMKENQSKFLSLWDKMSVSWGIFQSLSGNWEKSWMNVFLFYSNWTKARGTERRFGARGNTETQMLWLLKKKLLHTPGRISLLHIKCDSSFIMHLDYFTSVEINGWNQQSSRNQKKNLKTSSPNWTEMSALRRQDDMESTVDVIRFVHVHQEVNDLELR